MQNIRRRISGGRHAPLMPVSRALALVVTHFQMRSSSRHPLRGTAGLRRRSSILRTVPHSTFTVH